MGCQNVKKMNVTIAQQPLWHSYGAIAVEILSIPIYFVLSSAVFAIIIGRNVIPSIFHSCLACFVKKRKRRLRVHSIRASEFNIKNICSRQEVPIVSIFFLFFFAYTLYRIWSSLCMIVGLSTKVATLGSFTSLIVFTVMNGFDYAGFIFFLAYFCFYIILLSHVATIWFNIIDLGNTWKKKVFLSFVGIIIGICFFVGGILCFLAIVAGLVVYVFDQDTFYYIVAGSAAFHVGAHFVLTILASGIILFIVTMVIKYGSSVSVEASLDDEKISKLKIYSAKLVVAIAILFIANIFRLVGTILIIFDEIPIFVPTIISRILPDVLDMSICIIIYWPFPLGFCCDISANQTLRTVLAPMNFVAFNDKKENPSKNQKPMELEPVPSTPENSKSEIQNSVNSDMKNSVNSAIAEEQGCGGSDTA